jgi:predicted Zn-dependent protease
MRTTWLFALVAAALLGIAPAAQAEVFTHAAAGLQFDLPAGWKTNPNGDTLEASAPDGLPVVQFDVIGESDIEDYVTGWAEGAGESLTDFEITSDAVVEEVNGLSQIYSEGTANLEGHPVQWDLTIVKGGKKVLAVMALGEDLDGKAIEKIYSSIRKAK